MKLHGEKFLNFGIFSKIIFYAISLLQMIKPKHSNTYMMQGTVLQDNHIKSFLPTTTFLFVVVIFIYPFYLNMEYMMFTQNSFEF